jgi:hypothetical protein
LEAFNIRHSGLDPESRMYFWIPAFAGMTGQFGRIFIQRLGLLAAVLFVIWQEGESFPRKQNLLPVILFCHSRKKYCFNG